jgi:hypothetical protein
MYFKCKLTGNVYFFQYEADILCMKEHPQYECLGETIPVEQPKRKRKTEEQE